MGYNNKLNLKGVNSQVNQGNLDEFINNKDTSMSNAKEKDINIYFTKESDTFFPTFYRYEGKGILLYYRITTDDDIKNRIGTEIEYDQEFTATLQVLFKTYEYKNKIIFLEIPVLCKIKEIPQMTNSNLVDISVDMMPILRFYDKTPFEVREYEKLEELDKEIMEYEIKNKKHALDDLDSYERYNITYNYNFDSEYKEGRVAEQIRFLNNSTKINDLYMK